MKRLTLILFLLFWALTALLYWQGYGVHFLDDFISGVVKFQQEGWQGFADSYGFTSLYQGHDLVFYGYYQLFGASALAWYLLFTGLHSLNAALGFTVLKRLFANNGFQAPTALSFTISLLFLVSPYQSENVLWGATLHYAVSMLCMWGIMLLYIQYLDTGTRWLLWLCYPVYVFSLLTLEISLVFPGVFVLLFGILWGKNAGFHSFWRAIKTFALPMAVIIAAYLGATYLAKGHWIGHYGDSHLVFNPTQIIATFWLYWAKLLGLVHFLPYEWTDYIYSHLQKPTIALGLLLLALALWGALLRFSPRRAWFVFGWVGLVVVTLLPVLNMYFMYLNQGENDRLSYFASPFIYGLPIILLYWLYSRLAFAYAAVMVVVSLVLLPPMVAKWHGAYQTQMRAIDSAAFSETEGRLFLLNLPSFYDGIYVFRSANRFHLAREFFGMPSIKDRSVYVLSANMHLPTDSVNVTALDKPNAFKIELSAWGNWFWFNKLGGYSRTDEAGFSVVIDEWNHSYILTLDTILLTDRLLYFTPNGWQTFNPNPPLQP